MFFRHDYTIRNCGLIFSGDEELRFAYGGDEPIVAIVRPLAESERDPFDAADDLWCEVSAERTPPEPIVAILQAVAARRTLPRTRRFPPSDEGQRIKRRYGAAFDEEGRLKDGQGFVVDAFPDDFWEFQEPLSASLHDRVVRTIRALRWLHGTTGPDAIIRGSRGARFSFDGEQWHFIPRRVFATGSHDRILHAKDIRTDLVGELVALGRDEPLGHQLYREAAQHGQNARSALVIGIAAAEIGFKECVADLVPHAAWLVENVPSPPLDKMVVRYLPTLPARLTIDGSVKAPPKRVMKALAEGIEMRNEAAHRYTQSPIAFRKLPLILAAVSDLLWLLDYYRGMRLALDRLSAETQIDLGLLKTDTPTSS